MYQLLWVESIGNIYYKTPVLKKLYKKTAVTEESIQLIAKSLNVPGVLDKLFFCEMARECLF